MEEASFEVQALDDYKADLASELSLVGGENYQIIQTSENGWWYAANRDGETGWVPSNFVVRLEEHKPEPPAPPPPVPQEPIPDPSEPEPEPQEKEPVVVKEAVKQVVQNVKREAPKKNVEDMSMKSIEELLQSVKANAEANDSVNLPRALHMIAVKISQNGADDRRKLAEAGGFDTIVEIMDQTMGDIAVQMTCLKAVAMLCVDQELKGILQESKSNPMEVIHRSLKLIDHCEPHTVVALNCTCNLATLDFFRKRAQGIDIVNTIIGRVLGSKNRSNFYLSSSLALRNLLIDKELCTNVSTDLTTLVAEILSNSEEARTRGAACGIYMNIAQDAILAKAVIEQGGFENLQDLIKNPNDEVGTKKLAVEAMHNLCISASSLDIDSVMVISFLSSVLEMESEELRVLALRALSGYSSTCQDSYLLLRTLLETGALVQALDTALQMESEQNKTIALNIICFLGQGKNAELLVPPSGIESALLTKIVQVAPTMHDKKTIRNLLVLFYHIAGFERGQTSLIEAGFLNMLDLDFSEVGDAYQTMLGVLIKCSENKANMEEILEKQIAIKQFVSTVPKDNDQYRQLSDGLLRLLERLDVNYKTMLKQKQAAGGKASQYSAPKVQEKPKPKPAPAPAVVKAAAPVKKEAPPPAAPAKKEAAPAPPAPVATPQKKVQQKAPEPKKVVEEEVEAADEPEGNWIAYEVLKSRSFNRADIDAKNLEQYLSPTEFQKIFHMSKEQFTKLKGWKRVQLKKRNKLF